MHGLIHDWVGRVCEIERLWGLSTLEVGSYDVNGTLDDLFSHRTRVDYRAGPGVDVVADGEALPFPTGMFSVVVSTETLEHVRRPWLFVAEMARVASRAGGWVLLTTCGYGFGRHDFPHDYWRFSPDGLALLFEDCGLKVLEAAERERSIYMLGRHL